MSVHYKQKFYGVSIVETKSMHDAGPKIMVRIGIKMRVQSLC